MIDNIFKAGGPNLLAEEASKLVKSVIDSVLKINAVLVKRGGSWLIEKPADKEPMLKVWEEVEEFILSSNPPGKPVNQLIGKLLAPPFGLIPISIPVILAVPK